MSCDFNYSSMTDCFVRFALVCLFLFVSIEGRAVVTITTETDVQRRLLLLHPARMKRHEFEDWKSPKRP